MMSATGRLPVIAAPTATPVRPARARGVGGERGRLPDGCAGPRPDVLERGGGGETLHAQPLAELADGIAGGHPVVLFFLRPVVDAVDVADVMPVVPVRVALQEGRAPALARPRDQRRGSRMHGPHVLAVDA